MGQTEKKYIDDLLDGLYGVEGSFTQPAIFDAIEKAGAITTAITDNRVFNVTGIGVVEIWNIADIFKDIAEIGRAIDDYNNGEINKAVANARALGPFSDMVSRVVGKIDKLGGYGTYLSMVLSVGATCLKTGTKIITDHIAEIEEYSKLLDPNYNEYEENYNNMRDSLVKCGATLEQAQQFVDCYRTIESAMKEAGYDTQGIGDALNQYQEAINYGWENYSDYKDKFNNAPPYANPDNTADDGVGGAAGET